MTEEVWICKRCEITVNKRGDTWCPCPRGGCEAELVQAPIKKFSRGQVVQIVSSILLLGSEEAGKWIDNFEP